MGKPVDVDKLQKDAEVTMKNAQERKKADRWEPMSVSLDGMITYCENVIGLCERIKEYETSRDNLIDKIRELEKTIEQRDSQIESLRATIENVHTTVKDGIENNTL